MELALMRIWILAVGAVLVVTACGRGQPVLESSTMGTNGQVGQVLLRNVYVAQARDSEYEPGQNPTVRLTLLNRSAQPDALVNVTSPQARQVQLRWDQQCDGVAEAVSRIPLLAEGSVPPAPGQRETGVPPYHVEVINLTEVLRGGTTLPLTFTFDRAGTVTIDAKVPVPGDSAFSPQLSQCPPQPATR